jgi:hypothetical protein
MDSGGQQVLICHSCCGEQSGLKLNPGITVPAGGKADFMIEINLAKYLNKKLIGLWPESSNPRRLFLCRVEFIRPIAVGGYPHCDYIRDDRWNGNVVGRMNSTLLQWAK